MSDRLEPMAWQHLRADNDTNGNPRRCYVVYGGNGDILDVIDEGYEGRPGWLRDVPQLASVDVSPTEYRQFLKFAAVKTSR